MRVLKIVGEDLRIGQGELAASVRRLFDEINWDYAVIERQNEEVLSRTGRIVLELTEDATLANIPDIPLEDGDRLLMPYRPAMVSVFGTVYNESAFIHKPDKTVSDYLAQASVRASGARRAEYSNRSDWD